MSYMWLWSINILNLLNFWWQLILVRRQKYIIYIMLFPSSSNGGIYYTLDSWLKMIWCCKWTIWIMSSFLKCYFHHVVIKIVTQLHSFSCNLIPKAPFSFGVWMKDVKGHLNLFPDMIWSNFKLCYQNTLS